MFGKVKNLINNINKIVNYLIIDLKFSLSNVKGVRNKLIVLTATLLLIRLPQLLSLYNTKEKGRRYSKIRNLLQRFEFSLNLPVENSIEVKINDIKIKIYDISSLRVVNPTFENWIRPCLSLKEGDVFIDIGAHIGRYTLEAAKAVGEKGKVIAIEPHPINFKILNENIKLNNLNNVITFNLAAWYCNSKIKFFFAGSSGGGSVVKNQKLGYIVVDVKPVDEILLRLNLKPDWIKIDVEGAEFEVLQGLKRTLTQGKPKLIVEIHKQNLERVFNYMMGLGYRPQEIYSENNFKYVFFEKRYSTKIL